MRETGRGDVSARLEDLQSVRLAHCQVRLVEAGYRMEVGMLKSIEKKDFLRHAELIGPARSAGFAEARLHVLHTLRCNAELSAYSIP